MPAVAAEAATRLSSPTDLPKRPRTTSAPGVRIKGRGDTHNRHQWVWTLAPSNRHPGPFCPRPATGLDILAEWGLASRGSALFMRVTLPLASCTADAVAPHIGGVHPDEVRSHVLDPRLEPSTDDRHAFGLGIQMMRRPPCQHEPPLARFQIELVGSTATWYS